MKVYYKDHSVTILHGDCREFDGIADVILTDPPYALSFMGKEWDKKLPDYWQFDAGWLFAFGGTRTWHRLACAIEDSGWQIRDTIEWCHGQGFPKGRNNLKPAHEPVLVASRDLEPNSFGAIMIRNLSRRLESWALREDTSSSPATLASASVEENIAWNMLSSWRDTLAALYDAERTSTTSTASETTIDWRTLNSCLLASTRADIITVACRQSGWSASVSPAARYLAATLARLEGTLELSALENAIEKGHMPRLDGLGLVPLCKPIIVARKYGDIDIGAGRIPLADTDECRPMAPQKEYTKFYGQGGRWEPTLELKPAGRWPANLLLDEEAAAMLDEQSGELTSGANPTRRHAAKFKVAYGGFTGQAECIPARGADSGGASRFFYVAKASRSERGDGNDHPTVKPLKLMEYLVKLSGGQAILDPFCGSGTTLVAAKRLGRKAIGIDIDEHSCEIAANRCLATSVQRTDSKDEAA